MYHKMILAGNLGRDPDMRYLQDGTAVTSFSMAVSDGWGDRKKTIWFRVTCWRKQAELANNYLSKGSKILIEGTLRTDNNGGPPMWTAQDGTVRASFEVTATNITFLQSRAEAAAETGGGGYSGGGGGGGYSGDNNSGGGGGGNQQKSYGSAQVVEEDDIPF